MLSKTITQVQAINFRCLFASTFVVVSLFLINSCAVDDGDTYLYDKTGFDVGASPQNLRDPNSATTRVAPDYYYRQPAYAPTPYMPPQAAQVYQQQPYAVPMQQNYVPQPYQQPAAVYYQPQQASQVDVGGSRYYANPYAIPPSSQAARYYTDQYYVPPTYRNNIEPQLPQGRSVSY